MQASPARRWSIPERQHELEIFPFIMADTPDGIGRDYVDSLARGLDVLAACAEQPSGITLTEAARRTGTSRASARRSLLTLAAKGFVVVEDRAFRLTPKVLALARPLIAAPLPRLAQPILDGLSTRFGESFSIATLLDGEIVYVVRSEARRIMALDLAVGSRLPAYCTSMGRVMLAGLARADRAGRLPPVIKARTPKTVTDRSVLLRQIEIVETDGYCLLDEELELGLRSLAVPIRALDGTVALALNVSTQVSRMPEADLRRHLLPALLEAAALLSPAVAR